MSTDTSKMGPGHYEPSPDFYEYNIGNENYHPDFYGGNMDSSNDKYNVLNKFWEKYSNQKTDDADLTNWSGDQTTSLPIIGKTSGEAAGTTGNVKTESGKNSVKNKDSLEGKS